MSKNPRKAGNNVVPMPASVRENRKPARDLAGGTAVSSALDAGGPDDPRIQQLFRELFMVVFSDSPALRPLNGRGGRF